MAFTFGFYNSLNGDRKYDAVQLSQIFDGIISDGMYETFGHAMVVRESQEDNEVIVQSGRAWFNHTWSYNDADLPIEASQSDVYLDRYDAVVLDIQSDIGERENSIIWVTGEPSTNPQKPSMIHTDDHNQYPLAYVLRKADSTKITQANIENAVGSSECPFVTGIIDKLDVEELMLQWRAEWGDWSANFEAGCVAWMESTQADMDRWLNNKHEEIDEWQGTEYEIFDNWFDHMKGQLTEDAAANLQRQIDDMSYYYVLETTLVLPQTSASVSDHVVYLGHSPYPNP